MKKRSRPRKLIVRSLTAKATQGVLVCGPLRLRCALGRSGRRVLKREGDGASPAGRHRIVAAYYRGDVQIGLRAMVPIKRMSRDDGWCDDPGDRNYNRPVRLPYRASVETMWRQDHLYDVVLVLDYNLRPRVRYRGSAIFLHLAQSDYAPTEGCVAVSAKDMPRLLRFLRRECYLYL
jgi:L,D-peptidoglycan transpeptidase YkuD (ErfK/YbiS/YcfS/YnhG family)